MLRLLNQDLKTSDPHVLVANMPFAQGYNS